MDDYSFILNSKGDGPATFRWQWMGQSYGSTAFDATSTSLFQLLPTLMTIISNTLFPMNPMGAHLWNLGIHLGLAMESQRRWLRLHPGFCSLKDCLLIAPWTI